MELRQRIQIIIRRVTQNMAERFPAKSDSRFAKTNHNLRVKTFTKQIFCVFFNSNNANNVIPFRGEKD